MTETKIMHYALRSFVFVLFSIAHIASAAELTPGDIEFLKEESSSRFEDDLTSGDAEDMLYKAVLENRSPDRVVARFARSLGVDKEEAEKHAVAIVQSVRLREQCGFGGVEDFCIFEPGTPAYDAIADSVVSDSPGSVVVSIGQNLHSVRAIPRDAVAVYIGLTLHHPRAAENFAELFRYGHLLEFAVGTLAADPSHPLGAIVMRDLATSREDSCTNAKNPSFVALIDVARSKSDSATAASERITYALYTEALVWSLLWSGMTESALRIFEADGELLYAHLLSPAPDLVSKDDRNRYARRSAELALDLAYAYYDQNSLDQAEKMMAASSRIFRMAGVKETPKPEIAALKEIMAPGLSATDVYDRYVYGQRTESIAESSAVDDSDWISIEGWLFLLEKRPPVVRSIVSRYLDTAGYDDMAEYLSHDRNPGCHDSDDSIGMLLDILPESFAGRREHWRETIADNFRDANGVDSRSGDTDSPSSTESNGVGWIERNLPAEYQRQELSETEETNLAVQLPSDAYLPVDPGSIVRFDSTDDEYRMIYMSSAIDRPGEIPAYGFWYQQTVNGRADWAAPVYLGLQQYFPYVIVSDSKLPLFRNGKLQIEVEVREIDPASISFPPVALSLRRLELNKFIEIEFDLLTRDSDNDYLTDIVERRLGMNAQSRDSDGDGIDDGVDSLPLTAYDPSTPQERIELALVIVEEIFGYERAALMVAPDLATDADDVSIAVDSFLARPPMDTPTLFLRADPEIFSGIRLPDRLIVLDESSEFSPNSAQAPFYPVEILNLFTKSDGQEFYVEWSASWTGGIFVILCVEGACDTKMVSYWIT